MGKKPDFRAQIDEVRRTDTFGSAEFFSRFALVATGCAVGWLWLGLDIIPYWFAAYYAAVLLEKILLLQFPDAASGLFMGALIAISFVISGVYVALPVHMWYYDGDVWHFAAIVILVAGCLNIYQLRARVWSVALAYFVPIAFGFLVIAADFWIPPEGGVEFWSAIVLASLVTGYFALSVFEAHKSHLRLQRTQAQLIQSQKIEALECLAAGISHDFRNLLSIIQGNLELLQERPNRTECQACIKDALAAARNGSKLSAQLALYSRGVSAKPTRVDPLKVLEDVGKMARHVLPRRIRLQIQSPSTMDPILVDESALQAVLLNLIVHARDAVEGGGTISLETYVAHRAHSGRDQSLTGASVIFAITDTGAQSAPDVLAPFDEPERGPDRRRNAMALATALGFAENAGGDFKLECNPGRGMTYLLRLPVRSENLDFDDQKPPEPRENSWPMTV